MTVRAEGILGTPDLLAGCSEVQMAPAKVTVSLGTVPVHLWEPHLLEVVLCEVSLQNTSGFPESYTGMDMKRCWHSVSST